MTRLASIGPRAIHQPFTKAIYDQLQANLDWDSVAGAALAALTGGNTLNVTSRHHKVTIVGGTVDNIADAAGASEGQLLELYFTGANTIRNNGGGAGNIRTLSGQDMPILAGDVVELVFDGANWRECARAGVQLPAGGIVSWGSDVSLQRLGASLLGVGSGDSFSTGPVNASPGGGGNTGIYVSSAGFLTSVASSGGTAGLAMGLTTDTQWRLSSDHNGRLSWGPGGSTAPDSSFGRLAAGVLGDTATSLSSGPVSGSLNGAQTAGVLLNSSGVTQAFSSTSTGAILTGAVTTDNGGNYRVSIDASGKMSWAAGAGAATDTTLQRTAANTLTMSGTFIQTKSLESAPATVNVGAGGTFTPTHTQGLVQRVNCTGAGTVTIASPGTPTAGTTSLLVLIIHNASGGAVTLSWNAAYNTSSVTGPANGQGTIACWVWNPGTSKWTLFLTSVE